MSWLGCIASGSGLGVELRVGAYGCLGMYTFLVNYGSSFQRIVVTRVPARLREFWDSQSSGFKVGLRWLKILRQKLTQTM